MNALIEFLYIHSKFQQETVVVILETSPNAKISDKEKPETEQCTWDNPFPTKAGMAPAQERYAQS